MLLKYDQSGNQVWQKFYDFGNSEYGKFVNIDSHNNIIVTGFGTVSGQSPGWLTLKIDPAGNLIWYKRFKSNLYWEEFPYFTLTGPHDEIYVTGKVGVATGGTTYNGLETIRYNADGSNAWAADINLYGGIGNGLVLGNDMSLYAVGQYYYSVLKYKQSFKLDLKVLIAGLYEPISNKMVKDTAEIYLRNNSSPYSIIDSAQAMLDSNGKGIFNFSNVSNSVSYYIAVKHRNSLETWSAVGSSFISGSLSYDFTNAASKAYGNNQIQKGSKYCIYSGELNHDGVIDLSDIIPIYNDAVSFLTGYVVSDLTGDFFVDLSDLTIGYNSSADFAHLIRP